MCANVSAPEGKWKRKGERLLFHPSLPFCLYAVLVGLSCWMVVRPRPKPVSVSLYSELVFGWWWVSEVRWLWRELELGTPSSVLVPAGKGKEEKRKKREMRQCNRNVIVLSWVRVGVLFFLSFSSPPSHSSFFPFWLALFLPSFPKLFTSLFTLWSGATAAAVAFLLFPTFYYVHTYFFSETCPVHILFSQ